jgi:hypothetical protein
VKKDQTTETLLLFHGKDTVSGTVHVKMLPGKRIEHTGAKLELIGLIGELTTVGKGDSWGDF